MVDSLWFQKVKTCRINYSSLSLRAHVYDYHGTSKADFYMWEEINCARSLKQFLKKLIVLNWKKKSQFIIGIYLLLIYLFVIFASSSWFSCARFPSTGITGVYQHIQPFWYFKICRPHAVTKQASSTANVTSRGVSLILLSMPKAWAMCSGRP